MGHCSFEAFFYPKYKKYLKFLCQMAISRCHKARLDKLFTPKKKKKTKSKRLPKSECSYDSSGFLSFLVEYVYWTTVSFLLLEYNLKLSIEMSKTSTNVFVVIFPSLLAMVDQRNKLYFQKVSTTNIILHDVNKTSTKKKACKSRKVCVGTIGRTSIKN